MKLTHEFVIPVPPEQAWPVLLDIERIGPCLPGATITSVDGDDFTGEVKVKVGPIQVTYGGSARFSERDESAKRATIDARGKETRGSGTASATVIAELHTHADGTKVTVVTNLAITGKPAQFGRGVMQEVGNKLLGQFASCLADKLAGGGSAAASGAADDPPVAADSRAARPAAEAVAPSSNGANPSAAPTPPAPTTPAPPARPPVAGGRSSSPAAAAEPIDLLDVAGASIAKRVLPLLLALGAVLATIAWRRSRR